MSAAIARAVLLPSLLCLGLPLKSLACTEAVLIEPAIGSRVSESVLALRWRALPGVSEYRLQAEGRRLEAGIEWTADMIVNGTIYRLDLPTTERLMAVKLRVSAGCDAEENLIRAQPARILIDRR